MVVFCFLLSEGGFPYNINKGVFAQEKERATICEEGKEIDLPYITEKDETPLRENTLEAPIGRAVDEIEAVSEMIVRTLPALINAADQEAQAAKRMSDLAIKCGKDPYICESDCICQFVGHEDCGCSSGSVPGKENCGDTSLCPGGTCPSDEYRNGECGAYWKNPCPDEHCNNPPCPGNCYCDGGEPQSCYCKPVY